MIGRRLLRIKILQVLYAYFNTADSGLNRPAKDFEFSVNKAYDLYFYVLMLLPAMKRYAESRIDIARNKKLPTHEDLHPNTRFVDNRLIQQLEDSRAYRSYVSNHKLSWADYPELIKNLFKTLCASSYYEKYMNDQEGSYLKDQMLLIEFLCTELEDNELFQTILEERSIFWNDDLDFMLVNVVKTIKAMSPDNELTFPPIYKNDEDREFANKLMRATIVNYKKYESRIENNLDNWDLDRICLTDRLIMQMAINELVEFPFIPISVTFDEYLELSKYYSTAKSSVFINGILDKIAAELQAEDKITKYGRGLE